MKNVVFFVTSLDSGGLENYLLRFLTEKHTEFNDIYIYCKGGRGGQLEYKYRQLNNVKIIKKSIPYLGFSVYRTVRNFFIEKKIHIVCDFTGNFSGRILSAAKEAGVNKRVAFYRSSGDRFKKSYIKNLYNRFVKYLVYKSATDILSNSKAALNYFYPDKWVEDSRFLVVYNGLKVNDFFKEYIDLRKELSIPSDAFVIGHTGRYNESKNHTTILKVAERMVRKYTDVYFILSGNGVKENIQHYLDSKKLEKKILVFNNREDIPDFLNAMDCYFFPSITEGQPNSLIEAMIMGLPFVSSDIPSIRETVGSDHKLYNPLNVDELFMALENNYISKVQRSVALKNEMIEKFDHKTRFNDFFFVLNNRCNTQMDNT